MPRVCPTCAEAAEDPLDVLAPEDVPAAACHWSNKELSTVVSPYRERQRNDLEAMAWGNFESNSEPVKIDDSGI